MERLYREVAGKMVPIGYRQGDVLLVAIDHAPEGALPAQRDNNKVIIAYGEVTGHSHAILEPSVTKVVLAGPIAEFLNAPKGADLVHEEHGTISLPAGNYEIVHQREYTPETIVPVID